MSTHDDALGNAVTCASRAAVQAYDRAVDAQLHAWPGVQAALDEALALASGFALARALQALLWATLGRVQDARAEAERALAAAAAAPVTARERSHIEILALIVQGRAPQALQALATHAARYPHDLLAASTALGAYGLFAFSGRADHDRARLAFIESLAPHHPPEWPWLLAQRGWARIEAGAVAEGLAMARHALHLRPHNGHNAHIVMHGLFEQADWPATLAFLDEWLPGYPDDGLLWGHLHWHAALAEIALGRLDEASERLAGPVLGYLPRGTPFMGLGDLPSLLWRLALLGRRGLPWAAAERHVQRHFAQGSNVFGEWHLAMEAAARGDRAALATGAARLRALAERGHEGSPVAGQWVLALLAWLDGDTDAARMHLDACLGDAVRLGGSHAQRTLIVATREALLQGGAATALPVFAPPPPRGATPD